MAKHLPKLIGALLGLALALYAIIYLPMRSNYEECGRVTLCR